jgi:hypothetical protein
MWAAVICGSLAVVTSITTFLPGAPYVPEAAVMTLFVLVFPIYGAAFFREMAPLKRMEKAQRAAGELRWWQRTGQRDLFRRLTAPIPRRARVAIGGLCVLLWLSAMSGLLLERGGQPEKRGGRFFQNNHGEITEISRQEYDRAVASWTRAFASGASAFFVLAAAASKYGPLIKDETDT